jgi:hypothetical protein
MANAIDKQKGRRKMAMNLTRDDIHHVGSMSDGMEPKGTRHLFFCQVCAGHMHHYLPVGFKKSIGQLTLCQGGNNL